MIRILLVDDEPPARARMKQLLADCAGQVPLALAGEADSGPAALEAATRLKPDLVLLDISMPGMSGLEVARHLARQPEAPAVVFVTAFDEHALQAFEVHAVDYLLKPVRVERLRAALERVQQRRQQAAAPAAGLEPLARDLGSVRTQLSVSERGRLVLVPIDDIVYLRAELKYVTIRTPEREFLTEESLTALESEFGERFVRIHRNALVARRYIQGFQRVKGKADGEAEAAEGHWEILLRGLDERLAISRRQWPSVKAASGL